MIKAVSEGKRNFTRIAIYADSPDYCVPCGTCRQVLSEFAPSMEAVSYTHLDVYKRQI